MEPHTHKILVASAAFDIVSSKLLHGKPHVAFVRSSSGDEFVLKHCLTAAEEAFGLLLAAQLDVAAPACRVVTALAGRSMPSLLMERVGAAVELSSLTAADAESLLSPASAAGRRRLRSFGAVLALDLCLDNHDRFPVAWRGNGNAHNVLFGTIAAPTMHTGGDADDDDDDDDDDALRVVTIDQPLRCADLSQRLSRRLLDEYCGRIEALCCAVRQCVAAADDDHRRRDPSGHCAPPPPSPTPPAETSEAAVRMAKRLRAVAAESGLPADVVEDERVARAAVVLGRRRFDKSLAWVQRPATLQYLRERLAESERGDKAFGFGALTTPRHPLAPLRDFVLLATDFDLEERGCVEVGRGFLTACARACVVLQPGSATLAALEAELADAGVAPPLRLDCLHRRVAAIGAGLTK